VIRRAGFGSDAMRVDARDDDASEPAGARGFGFGFGLARSARYHVNRRS
jgi:hypothetical protein